MRMGWEGGGGTDVPLPVGTASSAAEFQSDVIFAGNAIQ